MLNLFCHCHGPFSLYEQTFSTCVYWLYYWLSWFETLIKRSCCLFKGRYEDRVAYHHLLILWYLVYNQFVFNYTLNCNIIFFKYWLNLQFEELLFPHWIPNIVRILLTQTFESIYTVFIACLTDTDDFGTQTSPTKLGDSYASEDSSLGFKQEIKCEPMEDSSLTDGEDYLKPDELVNCICDYQEENGLMIQVSYCISKCYHYLCRLGLWKHVWTVHILFVYSNYSHYHFKGQDHTRLVILCPILIKSNI